MMLSFKKVLVALAAVALVVAVAGAAPSRASAGISTSPGAGYGLHDTAGITDGTSNTIVPPGSVLLQRKAGGGPKEYVLLPAPFVPTPYPVSSTR